MSREEVFAKATEDITNARETAHKLTELGLIKSPNMNMLQEALDWAVMKVKN